MREIPLQLLDADHDHNDRFAYDPDKLRQLANGIAHAGLINPVRVTPNADRYLLRCGYRRLEAVRLLGWPTIPAIVVTHPRGHDMHERLAENLDRDDLTPVEEARAVARLRKTGTHTEQELATVLNRSPNWIAHRLALATYPEEILDALHLRQIKLGVADQLALVRDPTQRAALLTAARDNGCTARTAALWRAHANAYIADSTTTPTQPPGPAIQGPPPTVHKQCFACHQPFDITTLSYLTVCPACVQTLEQALRGPPAPPPSAPPPHP